MDCDVSCLHQLQKTDDRSDPLVPKSVIVVAISSFLLQLRFINSGFFTYLYITTAKFIIHGKLKIDNAYPHESVAEGGG